MPLLVVYFKIEMPYITYNTISLNIFGIDIVNVKDQNDILSVFKISTILPLYFIIMALFRLIK
jgi:hypothetical protein